MMRVRVLLAVLRKHLIELRRYWFDTLSALALWYVVFLLLFNGARALVSRDDLFGATGDGIIVGYMVWIFLLGAYSRFTNVLNTAAQEGTLEQLGLCPAGISWICLCDAIASFLVDDLLIAGGTLALMMLTTGRYLAIDLLSILPLLILTLMGVLGLSFLIGGIALIFKRIQSAAQLVNFGFIALIAVPIASAPALRFLPISHGVDLLRRVMIDGRTLLQIPGSEILLLAGVSIGYFITGLTAFHALERAARRRALLGHY